MQVNSQIGKVSLHGLIWGAVRFKAVGEKSINEQEVGDFRIFYRIEERLSAASTNLGEVLQAFGPYE
jgi:hypothetical protein